MAVPIYWVFSGLPGAEVHCSIRRPVGDKKYVVDWKYACLVNFPTRHAFEFVMLYIPFSSLNLRGHFNSFTTYQFMTSSWNVLYDVI